MICAGYYMVGRSTSEGIRGCQMELCEVPEEGLVEML